MKNKTRTSSIRIHDMIFFFFKPNGLTNAFDSPIKLKIVFATMLKLHRFLDSPSTL